MLHVVLALSILPLSVSCGQSAPRAELGRTLGYDLAAPDARLVLPDALREVSGITPLDATRVACIQDEKGILFIYDIEKHELDKKRSFEIDGDYEGIARVDKVMYVLRSDGTLFEISNFDSKHAQVTRYATSVPGNDHEGLCYDRENNRLLIACKDKSGKGRKYRDKRDIYGFDLKTKTLSRTAVFTFDVPTMEQFARDHHIELPQETEADDQSREPKIKFRTSDIGIHPLTRKLYVLSAADHLLFIFDKHGRLEQIEPLDVRVFNKAEGIAFLDSGDMLITNEGEDGQATLLRFNYRMR